MNLATAVHLNWVTPTANDRKRAGPVEIADYQNPKPKTTSQRLRVQAVVREMWATPTVCGNYNRKGASATSGDGLATQVGGALNPEFVEWLMSVPIGWTDSKPLEMHKFREWRDSHGKR
jgi:hypothetical protein